MEGLEKTSSPQESNMDNFTTSEYDPLDMGITSTSIVDEEDGANLIFGGSPASKPEDVKPIEEPEEEEDKKKKKEEPKVSTADDILGEEESPEEAEEEPAPQPEDDYNTFEELSSELLKIGVFTELDGEETPKTAEQFAERFNKEASIKANKQVYDFIAQKHGQEGVEAFNAIFVNGMDPKDYMSRYTQLEAVKELDINEEVNQEKVYREYYKRLGWNETKIEKGLKRLKDSEDLAEEAKDLHEQLISQEEEEMQEAMQQAELAEKQRMQIQQAYYNNLQTTLSAKLKDKEFDGIPVTDKVARETYDYLTTEKWVLPSGERLTDFDKQILELRKPENLEIKLKLALLLKNNLDLSKVKAKAASAIKDKLFDKIVTKDKLVKRDNKTPYTKSFFD